MISEKKKHSDIGGSSAHRFIKCAASVRLNKGKPKKISEAAQMGEAAHILAEKCIINNTPPFLFLGDNINGVVVDGDMIDSVSIYIDYIHKKINNNCTYEIEKFIEAPWIDKDYYGWADAVIYDWGNREIVIIDFKYGFTTVEIEENAQLLYYALPLFLKNKENIDTVRTVIIQPRAYHFQGAIREKVVTEEEFLLFSWTIEAAIQKTKNENAEPNAGKWCEYCNALAVCPGAEKKVLETLNVPVDNISSIKEVMLPPPVLLDEYQIAHILDNVKYIKKWIEGVEEHAVELLLEKGDIANKYELKQTTPRIVWKNEQEVIKILSNLYSENVFLSKKMKTPLQLKNIVDPKFIEAYTEYAKVSYNYKAK